MRALVAATVSSCLVLAACASEPVPNMRPLSAANIAALGPTKVSVTGNETGVAKSWYFTEVNGGGAGLVGVLAGAIVMVIMNAGPSSRAHHQADEVAKIETPERLNASLVASLKAAAATPPASTPAVTTQDVVLTQKTLMPGDLDDTVEITTSYTLSEDSSVLRLMAVATYSNKAIPYKTPYTFKKSAPSTESTGPLYRNVFTYYSNPLPVPTLTPELKARLVANIQDSTRDATGALPKEGSSDAKAMAHEIELANDDKLTATETAVFLTREWLKDNGGMVHQEVEKAHAFIAKYALLDMNRTAIPSMEGTDELVETGADQRTVRRVGAGTTTGSYISSAANVTNYATYGTTIAVGQATVEYVSGLKDQAKKSKK